MIFVGARFRALAGARAALRAVRGSVAVAPGDVGMRPLGSTRYEAPVDEFVVAGRFEPDDVERVIRLFHASGGRIVVRRIDSARAPVPEPGVPVRRPIVRRTTPPGRPAATSGVASGAGKRLRRPFPPLRARTARSLRIER